jgi:hypothetical protein
MVVEVSYAEWTPDSLIQYVVYLGELRQHRLEGRGEPARNGLSDIR